MSKTMADVCAITAQLQVLIRKELADRRTSIARLAEVSGVARGSIYAVLAATDSAGSLRVLGRLAEAVGAEIAVTITPGTGPAHSSKEPRRRTNSESGTPEELEAAPILVRWLSNAAVRKAWQHHPQDLPATAAELRTTPSACRWRLLVMGILHTDDPREVEQLRHYKAIADARSQGLSPDDIAEMVKRSSREVTAILQTLAISGRLGRPRSKKTS